MSKEQIEEMAKDICLEKQDCNDVCNPDKSCTVFKYVQKAYEQGYRKQEWISVIERLPEASGKYIVCTKRGNVYQTKFYSYPENKGGHWGQKDKGRSITHWMPLPEAPRKEDEGK